MIDLVYVCCIFRLSAIVEYLIYAFHLILDGTPTRQRYARLSLISPILVFEGMIFFFNMLVSILSTVVHCCFLYATIFTFADELSSWKNRMQACYPLQYALPSD